MANELIEPKDSVAAKIYIRNIGDGRGNVDKSVGVTIGINSEPIGKLYGGDWMWFPWDVDDDITIKPSVSTKMTVEYQVFS